MNKKTEIILKAMKYYGLHELKNGEPNKTVLEFLNDISKVEIKVNTPWCAAFVGSILKKCKIKHSGQLNARSYLKVGEQTKKPVLGDIVVFWRGNKSGWKGHVGFYVGENEHVIYTLSGNQRDSVCIIGYPKTRLLGYRSVVKKSRMAVSKIAKNPSINLN